MFEIASPDTVRHYLTDLQSRITGAVVALDGGTLVVDAWEKAPGERLQGNGITQILENGAVFERAGCGFSHVRGPRLPTSATQHRPELSGAPFEAMGVSLVFHPRNPYAPTVHMNVRMLAAKNPEGQTVCWFGGGMDLTPIYGFAEDAVHFHQSCKDALAPFGEDKYPRFKTWCDDYFFLKHRNEPRGIGGIFYDYVDTGDVEADFAFTRDVGETFLRTYPQLVEKSMHKTWSKDQRDQQLIKRGRYVEFNLLYDRGTIFGLNSGGNVEAILMSLPPEVRW
jgi:coproporphyrinogen III oxidase